MRKVHLCCVQFKTRLTALSMDSFGSKFSAIVSWYSCNKNGKYALEPGASNRCQQAMPATCNLDKPEQRAYSPPGPGYTVAFSTPTALEYPSCTRLRQHPPGRRRPTIKSASYARNSWGAILTPASIILSHGTNAAVTLKAYLVHFIKQLRYMLRLVAAYACLRVCILRHGEERSSTTLAPKSLLAHRLLLIEQNFEIHRSSCSDIPPWPCCTPGRTA